MKKILFASILSFTAAVAVCANAAGSDGIYKLNENQTIANAAKVNMQGSAENMILPLFKTIVDTVELTSNSLKQMDNSVCKIENTILECPASEPAKIRFSGDQIFVEFPGAKFEFVWDKQ